MPAGQYHVTVTHGAASASSDVEVQAGALSEQQLVLNVGYLQLTSTLAAGGEAIDKGLYYRVYEAKKDLQGKRKEIDSSGADQPLFRLPAGQYHVVVKHQDAESAADLEVTAGALSEHTLVIGQ